MSRTTRDDVRRRAAASGVAIAGFGHIEWWVGDADATIAMFQDLFGFRVLGPTRQHDSDRGSHVLAHGAARFVVTGPMGDESAIAARVRCHRDGVKTVGFRAAGPNVDHVWRAYGDTDHSVRTMPIDDDLVAGHTTASMRDPFVVGVDHVAPIVDVGEGPRWAEFYERTFGFRRCPWHGDDIRAADDAMFRLTPVSHPESGAMIAIAEPAGADGGGIATFLELAGGPGIQHVALATPDIVGAATRFAAAGARFIKAPSMYYDAARRRVGSVNVPWDELERLGILVDRDEHGHLLQVFTAPLFEDSPCFLELIQREGATGFGEWNVRALFEAVEVERAVAEGAGT